MRDQAIEAMARAYYRRYEAPYLFPYTEDDEAWRRFWTSLTEEENGYAEFVAALDALLDYLTEHADEWAAEAPDQGLGVRNWYEGDMGACGRLLIEALR